MTSPSRVQENAEHSSREGGNRNLAASAKALCQNCKSGHSSGSTSKPPCCAVRQGPLCAGSSQCIVASCSCPLGRDRPRLSRGGASDLQFNHLRFNPSVGVNSRFFASRSGLHHHIHTVGSLPEVAIEQISGRSLGSILSAKTGFPPPDAMLSCNVRKWI